MAVFVSRHVTYLNNWSIASTNLFFSFQTLHNEGVRLGLVGWLFRARASFRCGAKDQERISSCASSYVRRFQFGFGISSLILHHAVVQRISERTRFDGEVYVLGDISVALTNFKAFNFAATIPTTSPPVLKSGPPLLPG
jgi:hypothetical protein